MRTGKYPMHAKTSQQGFAYLALLVMVTVLSIMAYKLADGWSVRAIRANEAELLFDGDQIARAIASYYQSGPIRGCYPPDLEALLDDQRSLKKRRHLRKIYRDPMTNSDQWGLVKSMDGHVTGVFSLSKGIPLKQHNFPASYDRFSETSSYADWKFTHQAGPKAAGMSLNCPS